MSKKQQPTVLGSLPHTRPHRRSAKRPNLEVETTAETPVSKTPAAPVQAGDKPAPAKRTAAAAPKTRPATPKTRLATPKTRPASPKTRPAAAKSMPAKPAAAKPAAAKPASSRPSTPAPPTPAAPRAVETAVQAAAELAEIGLQASARALRRTLSRLPRP